MLQLLLFVIKKKLLDTVRHFISTISVFNVIVIFLFGDLILIFLIDSNASRSTPAQKEHLIAISMPDVYSTVLIQSHNTVAK